jgi:hypothetical protein
MLLVGILMLTHYLTKAYSSNNIIIPNNEYNNEPTLDEVYDMRPSKKFSVMFNEPSIWQGYETISNKNEPLGAKTT